MPARISPDSQRNDPSPFVPWATSYGNTFWSSVSLNYGRMSKGQKSRKVEGLTASSTNLVEFERDFFDFFDFHFFAGAGGTGTAMLC